MEVRVSSSKLKAQWRKAWTLNATLYATNEMSLGFGRNSLKARPDYVSPFFGCVDSDGPSQPAGHYFKEALVNLTRPQHLKVNENIAKMTTPY